MMFTAMASVLLKWHANPRSMNPHSLNHVGLYDKWATPLYSLQHHAAKCILQLHSVQPVLTPHQILRKYTTLCHTRQICTPIM